MIRNATIYFKVKNPYDFDVIDWDCFNRRTRETKQDVFKAFEIIQGKTLVGDFINQYMERSNDIEEFCGVRKVVYTHQVLKSGIHKFSYRITFEGEGIENPFHYFGDFFGVDNVNWL